MYGSNGTVTIAEVYEFWLQYGFGDESFLILNTIFAIYDQNSIDGLDELPNWVTEKILELLKDYKANGYFKVINSNGEHDYTYCMKRLDNILGDRI